MMPGFWKRLTPATRVAAGLVSLMISLILVSDLVAGYLPDRRRDEIREHAAAAAAIVVPMGQALRHPQRDTLGPALERAVRHEPLLRSAAIVSSSGTVIASTGDHAQGWTLAPAEGSTLLNARAPIVAEGRPWGELQLVFNDPADAHPIWRDPLLHGLLLVAMLGFIAFQLYLRRVLRHLDPSTAVPERVRTAFDTLVEGVLILDAEGRVLLSNQAFRQWDPRADERLTGRPVESLAWLVAGLPSGDRGLPWRNAIRDNAPSLGIALRVEPPGQPPRRLVMNCSPVGDGSRQARGCLTTFSDMTELEQRTEHLRHTLVALNATQAEIQQQNEELTRLATRDGLTGCLNRRAFMAGADQRFADARGRGAPACVIMCDIDHFKQVNDRYGHAGGDRVIQAAVEWISRGLRVGDLLGRYGGEEFCILLPDTTMAQALEVAERLRVNVEAHVGRAIVEPAHVEVTMSFGVAQLQGATPDPAQWIDRADQALYVSKKKGRNRVTAEDALALPA